MKDPHTTEDLLGFLQSLDPTTSFNMFRTQVDKENPSSCGCMILEFYRQNDNEIFKKLFTRTFGVGYGSEVFDVKSSRLRVFLIDEGMSMQNEKRRALGIDDDSPENHEETWITASELLEIAQTFPDK